MDDTTPASWEEQERREIPRLRRLLDSMGERIAELHREQKTHAVRMARMQIELDQLKDALGIQR